QRPDIASDSYLYVGDGIESLSITYDWMYNLLTPSQRSRWENYAEQAVWNIWNYQNAQWGGHPFPWSGWSVNNPGDNYFYSFIDATMHWALARQSATWMTFLENDRFPLLVSYFQQLPGGGSREGTGYGVSHRRLFGIYRVWKQATGTDLASQSSHARDSMEYWLHASAPTLDRVAPIGDHARESTGAIYDY